MYAAELTNRFESKGKPIVSNSEAQMSRVKRSVLTYLSKSDLNKTKVISLESFLIQLRSLGIVLTDASQEALRREGNQVDYEKALEEFRYDVHSGKWFLPLDKTELPALSPVQARNTYLSSENTFLQVGSEDAVDGALFDDVFYRMEDKFQRL